MALSNLSGSAVLRREYGYDNATGLLDTFRAGWSTIGGGPPGTWFQQDRIVRDAIGQVTSVTDQGVEPDGSLSNVKECFLYDTHGRLVRAHSTTVSGGCATSTTSLSTAAGSRDGYDQTWVFDDIDRILSRTDQLAASTTLYSYTGTRHAVVSLSGATTATYTYNTAGAMTARAGVTMSYDRLQRLTTVGSSTRILYTATNQRLIRTVGTVATLYLPGMEVAVTGSSRTITKWLTIDGTTIGTRTTSGGGVSSVAWNCGNLQNSIVCQTPATTAGTTPARRRYGPYGTSRNTITHTTTDHGYLNQPEDPTGLTYLNNRYYDPALGAFTSVDPLVGKTGTPYLYAGGSPITFRDPSGLDRFGNELADDCYHYGRCEYVPADFVGPLRPNQLHLPPAYGKDAAELMSEEMAKNREQEDVQILRGNSYLCFYFCQWDGAAVGMSLFHLGMKFKTGAEWDHKSTIIKMAGIGSAGEYIYLGDGNYVRADVFSNIHYGYIMRYTGEDEDSIVEASHGDVTGFGVVDAVVQEMVDFGETDDVDDYAVRLGVSLCNCDEGDGGGPVPTGAQIVAAILADPGLRSSGGVFHVEP